MENSGAGPIQFSPDTAGALSSHCLLSHLRLLYKAFVLLNVSYNLTFMDIVKDFHLFHICGAIIRRFGKNVFLENVSPHPLTGEALLM